MSKAQTLWCKGETKKICTCKNPQRDTGACCCKTFCKAYLASKKTEIRHAILTAETSPLCASADFITWHVCVFFDAKQMQDPSASLWNNLPQLCWQERPIVVSFRKYPTARSGFYILASVREMSDMIRITHFARTSKDMQTGAGGRVFLKTPTFILGPNCVWWQVYLRQYQSPRTNTN